MNINYTWESHPGNPLIGPVWPEWLIGDPVVLPAEESPDGAWHMFLNTVLFIYRYTSADGIDWKRRRRVCRGMRAFLFREDGEFFLFYELNTTPWTSSVMVRRSRDLKSWSAPRRLLSPGLKWEKGKSRVVSCPCVVKIGSKYRMYYSSGQVFLKDLGFAEPKYIGFAEADNIMGPYKKRRTPIIAPEDNHPCRNLGAGAIKVYRDDENDRWIGFNNGIYADERDRSRSAIMLLTSKDGVVWDEPLVEPVVSPSTGWEKALVYQLDAVPRPNGQLWLYYNARDNWRAGVERIGLQIGTPI